MICSTSRWRIQQILNFIPTLFDRKMFLKYLRLVRSFWMLISNTLCILISCWTIQDWLRLYVYSFLKVSPFWSYGNSHARQNALIKQVQSSQFTIKLRIGLRMNMARKELILQQQLFTVRSSGKYEYTDQSNGSLI